MAAVDSDKMVCGGIHAMTVAVLVETIFPAEQKHVLMKKNLLV
jgi:hypothetical protein